MRSTSRLTGSWPAIRRARASTTASSDGGRDHAAIGPSCGCAACRRRRDGAQCDCRTGSRDRGRAFPCELAQELRRPDAAGSCMANLASPSVGGLDIHSRRRGKVRDASREARGRHPEALAEGQVYRRRRDGVKLRLLDVDGPRVSAWNGRRVVRIEAAKVLETGAHGDGLHYEYLGGGLVGYRRSAARRR